MSTFLRQNHKEALIYLKAATYCFKKERLIIYLIIFFSVVLCFAGIFNRYITFFIKDIDYNIQDDISQIINIVSGTFIISQILINKQLTRLHKIGVNLMERYDCYVYEIPINKVIMSPINQSDIEVFARKVKRNPNQYYNYYFSSSVEAESKYSVFENQYKIYKNEYKLMNYVKPFYMVIWIGFVVAIIALAISIDDHFKQTLINTLIPSLSILSIIMSSYNSFDEGLSRLQNAINIMDSQRDSNRNIKDNASPIRLNSNQVLRNIQDGLFIARLKDFTIPNYFKKRFTKNEQNASWETPRKQHRTFSEFMKTTLKKSPKKELDTTANKEIKSEKSTTKSAKSTKKLEESSQASVSLPKKVIKATQKEPVLEQKTEPKKQPKSTQDTDSKKPKKETNTKEKSAKDDIKVTQKKDSDTKSISVQKVSSSTAKGSKPTQKKSKEGNNDKI